MELKTLLPGLFFSIGIFAMKSGIGLNYYISVQKSKKFITGLIVLFSLIYLLVFLISFKILSVINILEYYDIITGFMDSGMTLHFILAGLMTLWGAVLLKHPKNNHKTKSWLLLVLPCPVCMTVIFFSVAFCLAMLPDGGYGLAVVAWSSYVLISLFTAGAMNLIPGSGNNPERLLGASMIMIAGYFMLSVFIMPVFSDAARIYSIAGYKGETGTTGLVNLMIPFGLVFLMAVGIWQKRSRMIV